MCMTLTMYCMMHAINILRTDSTVCIPRRMDGVQVTQVYHSDVSVRDVIQSLKLTENTD